MSREREVVDVQKYGNAFEIDERVENSEEKERKRGKRGCFIFRGRMHSLFVTCVLLLAIRCITTMYSTSYSSSTATVNQKKKKKNLN